MLKNPTSDTALQFKILSNPPSTQASFKASCAGSTSYRSTRARRRSYSRHKHKQRSTRENRCVTVGDVTT